MQTRQIWLLILIAGLSGAFLVPAAAADDEALTLRVGLCTMGKLVMVGDNGKVSGFAIDLFERIAADEGWRFDYRTGTEDTCREWLYAGEVDLIFPAIAYPEDAESLDFSTNRFRNVWDRIFCRPDHPAEHLQDLQGRRIALVGGSATERTFRESRQLYGIETHLVRVATMEEAFAAVDDGRADFVVAPNIVAEDYAHARGFLATNLVFGPRAVVVAARRGESEAILTAIDRRLALLKHADDGYYAERHRAWFRSGGMTSHPTWLIGMLVALAGAAALLAVFGVVLQARVRQRTAELHQRNQQLEQQVEERERAEHALRQGERKYRELFEGSRDGFCMVDMGGRFQDCNYSFSQMLGYTKEELRGRRFDEITPPRWHHWERREIIEKQLLTRGYSETYQKEYVRKDGRVIPVELTAYLTRNEEGQPMRMWAVVHDVSRRQEMEKRLETRQRELAHAARVSMMGEMTSNLAHEINQPLSAVRTYTDVCLRRIRAGDATVEELQPHLEVISAQIDLVSAVVQRVRGFIARDEPQLRPCSMNDVVRQAVDLLAPEARHRDMNVEVDLADDLPEVLADEVQLEQVVLNLARNGFDAMADIGDETRRLLVIRTYRTKQGEAAVAVRDCGGGMTEEVYEHLFEPFFTSKAAGMGLGLSISRTIAEHHGGRLWAERNGEGPGMTMHLAVPAADEKSNGSTKANGVGVTTSN